MKNFTDTTGSKPVAFSNANLDKLIRSVIKHRAKNGSTISEADTASEVANYNQSIVDIESYSSSEKKLTYKPKITLNGATKACKALLNVAAGDVVPDLEIQRRWQICRNCPHLTAVSDCMSCGGAGKVSNLITSVRSIFKKNIRMPHEAAKRYCGHCGCSMALLLPTTMPNQKVEPESINETRPDQCWLKTSSDNYQP
jgi:hypothetical protein